SVVAENLDALETINPEGVWTYANGDIGVVQAQTGSPAMWVRIAGLSGTPSVLYGPTDDGSITDFGEADAASCVPPPPRIGSTMPDGMYGSTYSQSVPVSGGTGPYTVSLSAGSSLPPGLSLSNGSITGKPTRAGTYTFTVNASTSLGSVG